LKEYHDHPENLLLTHFLDAWNAQALWAHYSDAKERPQSQYLASAVSFGLEKLSSYFDTLILRPDVSFYAVATLLHPRLRLNWFQSHWKNYPQWYRKAHRSLERVFKDYLNAEVEAEDSQLSQLLAPTRRKLPNNAYSDDLFERTMAVDVHLLTNNKNKRQRRVGQLEEYFESLVIDLTTGSERDLELLDEPWAWWLQIGRNRYPILFKIATDYLSIHVRAAIVSAPSAPQNEPSPTIETGLAALQLRQYSCRRGG
jgi:hypothetical protein